MGVRRSDGCEAGEQAGVGRADVLAVPEGVAGGEGADAGRVRGGDRAQPQVRAGAAEAAGWCCAKRLAAAAPRLVPALEAEGALRLNDELRASLLSVSEGSDRPQASLRAQEGQAARDSYDEPRVPYRRALLADVVGEEARLEFERLLQAHGPMGLKRRLDAEVERLWRLRARAQSLAAIAR